MKDSISMISFILLLLSSSVSSFFFRPCNCDNECNYNPCPIPPVPCPEPPPCPQYNTYQSYPSINSYQIPNYYQPPPQPSYFPSPSYNVYTTGYQSSPTSYQAPPPPPLPLPSYSSGPAPYVAQTLPKLEPLPVISQTDSYDSGYESNKIYRPIPETVPASTIAYEKPDIVELPQEKAEYFPRMESITVEPLSISDNYGSNDNEPQGYENQRGNSDESETTTESGEYDTYKSTSAPYIPERPEIVHTPTSEITSVPSGYGSNEDGSNEYSRPSPSSTPGYGIDTPGYGNPTPSYNNDGSPAPPADTQYSDTIYPIPPPPPRNHRSDELDLDFDKSAEVGERSEMLKHIQIRRASTPPPIPRTSTTCNSDKLGDIMIDVIVDDVSISKRRVAKATASAFGWERFDVFCAKGEFSYSIHARKYCEVTKGDITCFAFR